MLFGGQKHKYSRPSGYSQRNTQYIDKGFQLRYTFIVVSAATFGTILSVIPLYYFLNQNYSIFYELAYEQAPQLLNYLEKERVWMNSFLASTFTGLLVFFSYIGFKMTARIAGPIHILKNHLRYLSRGLWTQKSIRVREDDEFIDLIESYNYFYKSFLANSKDELEIIKSFNIDKNNREAYKNWIDLIETKSTQLGEDLDDFFPKIIPVNDDSPVEAPDSRRAS